MINLNFVKDLNIWRDMSYIKMYNNVYATY